MGSATVKPPEIPVYNMTNDAVKLITWCEVLNVGRELSYLYPFERQVWYPDGDIRSTFWIHKLYCILFHWLPAYFIDFMMYIFIQKRFVVRIARNIEDGLSLLQVFTTRDWLFESKHFLNLNNDMTDLDREIYRIDFEALSVEKCFTISLLGARQYLMKEDLSTLPRCRRAQKLMYIIHKTFVYSFYLGIIWILCQCSETVRDSLALIGSYLRNLPVVATLIPTLNKL